MQIKFEQPHIQLAILARNYVLSRAIQVIAKLGVANHMSDLPKSVSELASLTQTLPQQLDRLMNFMSAYGLFTHSEKGYALTPLSNPLRDDDPYSIRDVLCMVDECWWQAFANMEQCLKTGEAAFSYTHGAEFFEFMENHPKSQHLFDKGMAKLSTYDDHTLAKAHDFSEYKTIVDLGGGRGGLIKALAQDNPDNQFILFDTEAVIKQLDPTTFPANVSLKIGSFFAELPKGDAYFFKGVLHDFNDQMLKQILSNCRQQIAVDATLFIAEQILPDDPAPHPNKTMDIVMMVLLAGRQRSLKDWHSLINPYGFKFEKAYPTESVFTLMKFKPV